MRSITSPSLSYERIRTPSRSGELLVRPGPDRIGELLAENRELAGLADLDLGGRTLRQLASEARLELILAADAYTRSYRDVDLTPPTTTAEALAQPILLGGHQPQLFHPGVWIKNFAMHHLARKHRGWPVNLIIDADTQRAPSIRVPTGSVQTPRVENVLFDAMAPAVPFEEREIHDFEIFHSFGKRASEKLRPLVEHPLLHELWPLAQGRTKETNNLGLCIAQSRHQLESQFGAHTWELPQSHFCRTEAFRWFVAHLLVHAQRFCKAYNEALVAYRQVNHIRSKSHPVPELLADSEGIETPFWIWQEDNPRRRQLFVTLAGNHATLSDRHGWSKEIPLPLGDNLHNTVDALANLGSKTKLRPRALMTTMFSRLFLSDLFLHGIGGAKYDQLTDEIIRRFFQVEPPAYLTISATLHLPIPREPFDVEELRSAKHRLWEMKYHPEEFISETGSNGSSLSVEKREAWIAKKRQWVSTPTTPENGRIRRHEIRKLNEAIQPWVDSQREETKRRVAHLQTLQRHETILASREYAFCLFPSELIQRLVLEIPSRSP